MTAPERRPPNQSADRLLRVLSLFVRRDGPLGVAEISRSLHLDKSVVHRILATLAQHGYLEQEQPSRKYRLGLRAWELGQRYAVSSWVSDAAVPLLAEVLAEHGSTGYAATLDRSDIIYLATVDGTGPFQVTAKTGSRTSAFTTAIGRAILACMPGPQLVETLDAADFEKPVGVHRSPISRLDLEADLEATRQRGYAINRGQDRLGVGAVGAAVIDHNGMPVAGLSIAFPMMSEFEHLWDTLPPEVQRIADEVSRRL